MAQEITKDTQLNAFYRMREVEKNLKQNHVNYSMLDLSNTMSLMLAITSPILGVSALGFHIYAAYKSGFDAFLDIESDFYTLGLVSISALGTRYSWKNIKNNKTEFKKLIMKKTHSKKNTKI